VIDRVLGASTRRGVLKCGRSATSSPDALPSDPEAELGKTTVPTGIVASGYALATGKPTVVPRLEPRTRSGESAFRWKLG